MHQQQKYRCAASSSSSSDTAEDVPQITLQALQNTNQHMQLIGEMLYMNIILYVFFYAFISTLTKHIFCRMEELAGKVIGMLLEMDECELIHLLSLQETLTAKVIEAVSVLQEFKEHHVSLRNSALIAAQTFVFSHSV